MFKKTLYIFFISIFLFFIYCQNSVPVFFDYSDNFYVYINKNSSQCNIVKANRFDYLFLRNKKGMSCTVNKGIDELRILKDFNAEVKFTEKYINGYSVYAYSNKIDNFITLKKSRVNIQIYIESDRIIVGTPIIYGSF